MALVNALQHNSLEMLDQQRAEASRRFLKIRSIWPFPVKGEQAVAADGDLPSVDDAHRVAHTSFVT